MTLVTHAFEIVKAYGDRKSIESFLETMEHMKANPSTLTKEEAHAFDIVMKEGRAMFAPIEG